MDTCETWWITRWITSRGIARFERPLDPCDHRVTWDWGLGDDWGQPPVDHRGWTSFGWKSAARATAETGPAKRGAGQSPGQSSVGSSGTEPVVDETAETAPVPQSETFGLAVRCWFMFEELGGRPGPGPSMPVSDATNGYQRRKPHTLVQLVRRRNATFMCCMDGRCTEPVQVFWVVT